MLLKYSDVFRVLVPKLADELRLSGVSLKDSGYSADCIKLVFVVDHSCGQQKALTIVLRCDMQTRWRWYITRDDETAVMATVEHSDKYQLPYFIKHVIRRIVANEIS